MKHQVYFGWETFLAFFPIFWFWYLFKGSYNQISFLIFIFKHAKHNFDFSSNLFFSVILHVTNFGHCSEKAQLKPHYNPQGPLRTPAPLRTNSDPLGPHYFFIYSATYSCWFFRYGFLTISMHLTTKINSARNCHMHQNNSQIQL